MPPVTLLIIGGGSRGAVYAEFAARHPDLARVVGVAEPREFHRERLLQRHEMAPANAVSDWRALADRPRFADAAVIATPDALHAAPAVAFAQRGYHLLLEKPMAPNEADCRRIVEVVLAARVLLAVGHVMRYSLYTQALKRLLDAGLIGEIVNVQHLEPVGYWHQAHSFVRGHWRSERESSPMLLSKSCHDLDWLRYIVGQRCVQVSSFGALKHFTKSNRPPGAADRCLDCRVEPTCPYSAKKIYLGRLARGVRGWPVDVLTPDLTVEGVTAALRAGPYGRCVYECDNDVVDNQVVNLLFDGGATASFTMTAFTEHGNRRTTLFGTRGELRGDGARITHFDFLTDRTEVVSTTANDPRAGGGHGGADQALMHGFLAAVAENDPRRILSGPEETLETHLMVFAAERARREGTVVRLV
jgi:predicted dehydrogenase